MPAFRVCGLRFLISPDDFVFFIPWLIPLHLLWAYLDYSDVIQVAMDTIKCPDEFRQYDAILLVATVPLDFIISILSAWGPIMQPRKCEFCLKAFVVVRLLMAVPILLNFTEIIKLAWAYFSESAGDLHKEINREGIQEIQENWGLYLLLALSVWRLLWYVGLLCFILFLFVPLSIKERVFDSGLRSVLFLLGCRDNIVNSLMKILMNDLGGTTTIDKVAPSDWMFGLFLAAAAQKQGLLGYDPDASDVPLDEGKKPIHTRPHRRGKRALPPTIERASVLHGASRPVTPLDPESAEDHAVMNEIVRLMPYASGIYGQQFGMSLIKDMVEPGTHLPTMCGLCRACCVCTPCVQAHACDSMLDFFRRLCCCVCYTYCCPAPGSKTEDDFSSALNEDALHRSVANGAKRCGTPVPELIWASWKNAGPTTSPPIAVLVDHQRQEIIVTVRGTADIKDCIADAGAKPLFFDPFGWAKPGQAKHPPFNSEEDLFVHGTMLLCAEDTHHRLRHKRILEDLLAETCRGYGIVCVGHSLGAGIAALLALILYQTMKETTVRYVGFEPPGGLLCPRISRETQRLGWFAVVCSHDWVPRIGIRNLQKVKVLALDELHACKRSKLQLSWLLGMGIIKQCYLLCCLRRPLAAVFRCLGGGALPDRGTVKDDEEALLTQQSPASITSVYSAELTFPDLFPPGDIVYFRPTEAVYKCGVMVEKDTEWAADWADPEDLNEMVLTARAIDLHVPWIYEDAIENVASAFEEQAHTSREVAAAKDKRSKVCCRSLRKEFAR